MQLTSMNACGLIEYSPPNSRWGFFDECVTQRSFDDDPGKHGPFVRYRNYNNEILEDIYGNANSFQCHCMDISGELMTFCVGGPRYFENNLPLGNSPLWTGKNMAFIIWTYLGTVSICTDLHCSGFTMSFQLILH